MRIVIDMQGAQTASRTRGIGRYSLSLARAIARNRGPHEVILALNGLFPDTIQPIRRAFAGLLPRHAIHVWEAPAPIAGWDPANEPRRRRAELVYEAFLASLEPDIVHVSSVFEGFVDDAATSIGALRTGIPTSATLYDLIPLHDPDRFLAPDPAGERFYREKLGYLQRPDLLLAISEFTARDAMERLGPGKARIVNVSAACDGMFRPPAGDNADRRALMARLGIGRPYIFTAGTIEPHKNLERFFAAIARLTPKQRGGRQVVLMGHFVGRQQKMLRKMASRAGIARNGLIVTGYVSDEDLVRLYGFCDLMVCPSLDEGFGLPVLEAMACGAPTVGSRAASIPEIIGRDDALFDPTNVDDMARVIGRALDDDAFRTSLRENAATRASSFSWDKTARAALAAMETTVADRIRDDARAPPAQDSTGRLRLAVVAGSETATASDDDHGLVGMLRRRYDVTIVAPDDAGDRDADDAAPSRRDANWLRENADGLDRILYAMGDGSSFVWMTELLRDVPGILALDDVSLGPVLEPLEASVGAPGPWTRALYETHGYAAVRDRFRDPVMAAKTYPACLEALRIATGIVIGSEDARNRATPWLGAETTRAWAVAPLRADRSVEAWGAAWVNAIETLAARAAPSTRDLAEAIAAVEPPPARGEVQSLAGAIARSMPPQRVQRRLLLDVSHTAHTDLHTGIQRVTRALVAALLNAPPDGYRIEPVYLAEAGGTWHYRYARRFALKLLGCPSEAIEDDIVEPSTGDVLFVLDLSGLHLIQADASGLYKDLRNRGLAIYGTVYDLLPVTLPHLFPAGSEQGHDEWLRVIAGMDGAICISRAVADELAAWVGRKAPDRKGKFRIGWFHLGADIENSVPTRGLPDSSAAVFDAQAARPTFLMVSTVEPRKGYLQALRAFDRLWANGVDVNLVIVGAQGWTQLPEHLRSTIPEIVSRLRNSPERDRRLFWLAGISDEYLERVYAGATCLISASEGEGFGLPLIEAARHGIPILARDIPVFREVAGDHVTYFRGLDPADLASAVTAWIELYRQGRHTRSEGMPRTTWKETAASLGQFIRDGEA